MIEIDDLRYYLGLGDMTAGQVIALTDVEQRTVEFVEQQTGRHFGPVETMTEYLAGTGIRRLWLKESPDAITSVRDRPLTEFDWTTIAETDDDGWELRGRELLRRNGFGWTTAREYEVVYDFGYAAGTEPGDIRQLVMDLVKMKWDMRDRSADLISETEGAQSRRYASPDQSTSALLDVPWVRETIANYRHPRAA